MNREFVAQYISSQVKQAKTLKEACEYLELSGFPVEAIEQGRALYEEEVRRIAVMKRPAALRPRERRDWYPGPADNDIFWPALHRYLLDTKGWDPDVVKDLDRASTKVVSLLDPPGQETFATRGLVLGYVQSGKTANFTAVTAKAADAGYRLFIVLSGMHNALRRQTQVRLESELVALEPKRWLRLTSRDADFVGQTVTAEAHLSKPDNRMLAVVKKNPAPLQKLIRWLRTAGQAVLRECPTLIIDDEADQASLNTRKAKEQRSRINELIVELLGLFPRCAYVGYTATPFANVLSDPGWPPGLYPRHFIVDLPEPAPYFGARRIFGTPGDALDDGLDVIRLVPDGDGECVQPKSRDDRFTFQPELTDALREALQWFWMAVAVRLVRGQGDQHMGMLIHTTFYTDVHERFRPLVEQENARLLGLLGAGRAGVREVLHTLWERETAALSAQDMEEAPVTWEAMLGRLPEALERTRVAVDNAPSVNRLEYPETGGSIQVVIGGNTLSRGLTIEGLMVSYFMRATNYYDTLMQMGRWFGYRFGYSDLPRLWMSAELATNFQHLAMVEQEIREDISRYEREDITPVDVGVNVQTHSTMAITSTMKMLHSVRSKMTFARAVKQTTYFKHEDADWLDANISAARKLLATAHDRVAPDLVWGRHILYRGVEVAYIREFLRAYEIHGRHEDMHTDLFLKYIDAQTGEGRLRNWNVGVVSQRKSPKTTSWDGLLPGGKEVTLLTRSRLSGPGDANLKAIMSPVDRALDFGLDSAPRPNRFLRWAADAGFQVSDDATFVSWCLDHRSPVGEPDDLTVTDPARGLRTPLLLLYPIDKDSDPGYPPDYLARRRNPPRQRLAAERHVVGLALVFPQTTRHTPQDYVTANLSRIAREEPEIEDEADEL